ncbi:MAG: hypothetical protein K6E50_13785 [Lachnospiraceae bacterium]|nr:hypothetical protein [Lachnospiraceae bacterium]
MAQKTLINEETIRKIEKGENIGLGIAVGIMIFGALVSLFFFTNFIGLFLAAIFIVIIVLILKHHKKRGALKVYFKKKTVLQKYTRTTTNDEGDDIIHYYLRFDTDERGVFEKVFRETQVGDQFFVMYDAYDDKIREIYSVFTHELAPTLDIREVKLCRRCGSELGHEAKFCRICGEPVEE